MDIIAEKTETLIERQGVLENKVLLLDVLIEKLSEKLDEISSIKEVFNNWNQGYKLFWNQ